MHVWIVFDSVLLVMLSCDISCELLSLFNIDSFLHVIVSQYMRSKPKAAMTILHFDDELVHAVEIYTSKVMYH